MVGQTFSTWKKHEHVILFQALRKVGACLGQFVRLGHALIEANPARPFLERSSLHCIAFVKARC